MPHMMQTTAKQQSQKQQQGKGSLQLKEISIIPITAAPVNNQNSLVVEKATNSHQSMADDDSAELLRKKRCTDRYDSSESSDSGVVTMSADSTATSDSSDPGSPFSNTSVSTCTDDVTAQKSNKAIASQTINGKALKRQAQVTEKGDKKRVRKEIPSKKGNVEIKLIPISATQSTSSAITTESVVSTIAKKANLVKSTLSAITNNINVFKNQAKPAINNQSQPSLVIPTQTQQTQMTNVSSSTGLGTTISKLTDYYKLKKDLTNNSNIEKYCNMLLSLQQQQTSAKQNNQNSVKTKELTIATAKNKIAGATTITPITSQSQKPPLVKVTNANQSVAKKSLMNEKKTAKIAPIIPVARKSSTITTQAQSIQQPVKISPKKPVSIAPRIVAKTLPNNGNGNKNPTAIIHPKAATVSMTTNCNSNDKYNNSIGSLSNISVSEQLQQQQQPTVLLAAIRIPNQLPTSTQPPPLKIQNGLMQKSSTTMTTKLAPLLQFHTQQMIPNLIQLPNLIATTKTKQTAQNSPLHQNLMLNNTQLTQQQQQQLFMNGAVIKLQPVSTQQTPSQTVTSSTTVANMTSINGTTQKFTIQQQQQAFTAQLPAQHMQQLFMTTPVLFNTSSIPTVLTSQLAGLQHAFNQQQAAAVVSAAMSMPPALQPIQSSLLSSSYSTSSLTSTTNSIQLPSFSTLIHSHAGLQAATGQHHIHNTHLQQIPTLMKSCGQTSLPPSLTITSGFVPNTTPVSQPMQHVQSQHQQQKVNVPPQATIAPSQKANPPPPLAPASHLGLTNFPKLISVASSSCQTSPKSPPPLIIPQKVSLPHGSPIVTLPQAPVKQEPIMNGEIQKTNAICIVPPLPSPEKILKVETQEKITVIEASKDSIKSAITITVEEKATVECAKSPILSQPKTIRFPPVKGKVTVWKKCIRISKTGVCNWEKCSKQFDSNADLLEHLHMNHINEQGGPFICSWRDCKVNGREGSKGWLERHVMSHVGSKPYKCIFDRCGSRFSSQVQLEKHVNGHFNSSDQQINCKRPSDPPMPKKVKKDQKKTKVRRQPWSARRFDFFDVGMMDVLQYRLEKAENIMHGREIEVTFKGRIIGKRRAINGDDEFQVTWSPLKILGDEWMKKPADAYKPNFQLVKHVSIKRMSPMQRIALEEYVNTVTNSNHKGPNGVKQLRKCSSTCSSQASVTSAST
ncbi:unnamed protein product [Chironomus riparius]|uniref:C2H2-type domain-containing protein n=1 Tax=Chironomus riparius TaxID=315576 RepID=A0A9N9RMI4_9DIPT|nr:unnamed protein product [Chironomus riparius]